MTTIRCLKRTPTILLALLLSAVYPVFSEETDAGGEMTAGAPSEGEDGSKVEEDRRELTLLYGIDSEVLSVLANLRADRIGRYNELLLTVLPDTRNTEIAQAVYGLWSETEWDGGLEAALADVEKVLNDEDYEAEEIQAAIAYLADREYADAVPVLSELSGSRESRLAASAIRALGKIAVSDNADIGPETGEALLERFRKEDPVAEDDLVASLIVTLGLLEYPAAANDLVALVEDAGAPAGHRRMACISIGQIGREIDYGIIENLYFESTDATLRSYALAGLAEFDTRDSTPVLIQALKRDSFWRIRVTAADKLGEGAVTEAADLLRYKADNDPVNHVRISALKALGRIADRESRNFLLEYYKNERNGTDVRLTALSVLVENHIPGTPDAVSEIMDRLWENDQGRFLEYTCRELSRADWNALGSVYERMLQHSSWLVQVYGIRGIRRNNLVGLMGKVNALDRDGVDGRTRREVTNGAED